MIKHLIRFVVAQGVYSAKIRLVAAKVLEREVSATLDGASLRSFPTRYFVSCFEAGSEKEVLDAALAPGMHLARAFEAAELFN
jgi:hypothetical protein